MKNPVQNNFEGIRKLITKNVDTIIMLVDQAKGLEEIVNSIKGTTEQPLKVKLEEQLKDIKKTIGTLVAQTDELFESYDAMVEDAFNK